MIDDNLKFQIRIIPANLLRIINYLPFQAEEDAKQFLNIFLEYTQRFLQNPKDSPIDINWIMMLIKFYSMIDSIEVSDTFLSKIDLPKVATLCEPSYFSSFSGLITYLISYLKKMNSAGRAAALINSIFQVIDMKCYAIFINKNVEDKLLIVSQPNYASESIITWASLIKMTVSNIKRLSNLIEDQSTKDLIEYNIYSFFSNLDFGSLGTLMEAQKKGIGPVIGIIDLLKSAPEFDIKQMLKVQFLSKIDFKRLAISYNEKPISISNVIEFGDTYFSTRVLEDSWKTFFENLNFHLSDGFSYVNSIKLMRTLTVIMREEPYKFLAIMDKLGIEQIGRVAREKKLLV